MRIEIKGLSKSFGAPPGGPSPRRASSGSPSPGGPSPGRASSGSPSPGGPSPGRPVLDGISYSDDISTLSIIGPSGGGKSTLLRIIGGLLRPTAGSVRMNGVELPESEADLIQYRKRVGFVFQQGGLFSHLTGFQNIALPLTAVHGFSKKAAEERALGLLERFGLLGDAHKKPGALSGGQQQRIAIARAVAPKPEMLLLDEPTSALDPEYTTEVLDMVDELKREGMDFIIVTHEMGFAWHACEKVAFLCEGRLMEAGPCGEVFARPRTPQLSQFMGKLLEWNV